MIIKLFRGEFGLAKTFWLWGGLSGVIYLLVAASLSFMPVLVLITFVYACYAVLVTIGVWRAACQHQGMRVIAILARVVSIVSLVMLLIAFVGMLEFLFQP